MAAPAYPLSESDVANYRKDGIIFLPQVIPPRQVEALRRGIDRAYRNPSERHKIASEDSDTGRFFEDFRCWKNVPEYQDVIFHSALPEVAAKLLGSKEVRLHHDHMLIKEAKTKQRTPWHQDTPYYNIVGDQTISFWITVDPVPLDSAMEFVKGSHKWPMMMPRTFKDNMAKWFPEGSLPEIPDIEGNRGQFPIVSWGMRPGDALGFSFNAMHAAKGSTSLRRALSIRYCGDDVRHARRAWVTSPPFPELDEHPEELPDGAPLRHELFPLVYPRQERAKL